MGMVVSRFEVYLVRLDPTEGREIRKTRPCVVVSPDEMNRHLDTVIIALMTTKGRCIQHGLLYNFKEKLVRLFWTKYAPSTKPA
jgi:mRNA interferase MazF